jgi:hypothetical protein
LSQALVFGLLALLMHAIVSTGYSNLLIYQSYWLQPINSIDSFQGWVFVKNQSQGFAAKPSKPKMNRDFSVSITTYETKANNA